MTASREADTAFGSTEKTHLGGGVSAFELSIGGTPGRGLVVAGTLLTHDRNNPVLRGRPDGDVELSGRMGFAMIGMTVDWYPNPRGGFHFGGTLGLAALSAPVPPGDVFVDHIGGGGGGISLATGYDWWIGEQLVLRRAGPAHGRGGQRGDHGR